MTGEQGEIEVIKRIKYPPPLQHQACAFTRRLSAYDIQCRK